MDDDDDKSWETENETHTDNTATFFFVGKPPSKATLKHMIPFHKKKLLSQGGIYDFQKFLKEETSWG